MIDNDAEWISFAAEMATFRSFLVSFSSFSIRFLPRTCNVRADSLAKKARAKSILFSHVSSSVPDWLPLKVSLFLIS